MRPDALRQVADADAPETVRCAVCRGTAECKSSAWQGEGTAYHNYHCRTESCPATGTIIEHESAENQSVGPVFGDPDLAVRLATRDHPDAPAESREVAP